MITSATFDGNIDDKIIAVILDEYSMLSCVDMNWLCNCTSSRTGAVSSFMIISA